MVSGNPLVRTAFLVLGVLFTGLAAVGAVLPILPATPFAAPAAFFFVKSSPVLHRRLIEHPKFGPGLQRIREGKGVTLKTKIVSTSMAALTLGSFAVWGTDHTALRIIFALVIVAKIIVMILIPTYRSPG